MSRLLAEWVVRAYLAGAAVGVTAPVVGSFLVQRRLALIGDGMGHLAFAGVALGVALGASPLWGALLVAGAGALLLEGLRARGRLAGDVSLAIVFYVGIALGSVLLSAAGRFDASVLGVLFGSILTATWADVAGVAALCALVLAATAASYPGLLAVALDEETARASGLPVERLNLLLLGLLALLVAAGMRVVGLLLVASLLVIPVAAGSRLAHSFRGAVLWGAASGVASVLVGLVAAVWQGRLAPGGTIVLASAGIFALASAAGRRAARRHPRRALP
ncbi:MAG TPA: metal ABC transporter permease [Actinomycetota bacterium]|nr:metal ABC transporter permease [Actinomycetota bacterium]